jgi:DnaK suppressor protein
MASRKRKQAKPGKKALAKAKGKLLSGRRNGAHVTVKVSKSNGQAAIRPRAQAIANRPRAQAAAKKAEPRRSEIVLPIGYKPDESEPFMSERQRIYFRNKLLAWREEIVRQNRETLQGLHEDSSQHADLADRATFEADRALELRARDRQRKLISKIDSALARIEDGSYGFCEETGEPISLKRLDARPIATLSLEAQERHERRERVFRED